MSKRKKSFLQQLTEFDGTGVGSAFSANVLQHTQMTQDPEKDQNEKDHDHDEALAKEIQDALDQHDDSNLKPDDEEAKRRDGTVLKHLKNLLFKTPGYEFLDEPEASGVDHEQFVNDQPIGLNPVNPPKSPDYSVTSTDLDKENAHDEDEEDQLLAAIRELRDELRKKDGSEPETEQEEYSNEEDEGEDSTQFANASKLFQSLVNQKLSRSKIIANFEKQLGVTNSTATSYYQRLAKNAGLTNSGDRELEGQPPGLGQAAPPDPAALAGGAGGEAMPEVPTKMSGVEVPNDPNKQGLIRYVRGAHLVFKKQNEEGTYDELWLFSTNNDMEDSLQVRRNILAGTDIPPRSTKSLDGKQSYTLKTLGNGQILNIKGLPN